MKQRTMEEKKKLPKYIKSIELEEYLNSEELKNMVEKLKKIEEYKEKLKNTSIGVYQKQFQSRAGH